MLNGSSATTTASRGNLSRANWGGTPPRHYLPPDAAGGGSLSATLSPWLFKAGSTMA
jgi:hypothetical protein